MSLEIDGFFSPGRWGFMEGWPRGADGPVFDICYGDVHVARLMKDRDGWRLLFRRSPEISTSLEEFMDVLRMVQDRIRMAEDLGPEQAVRITQVPNTAAE
jgi:hypothetical protein